MRFVFSILGLALLAGMAWLLFSLYAPYRGFPASGVYVDIPRGTPERGVARLLAGQGVIRSRWAFDALSRWRRRSLQAGEYFFDRPATSVQVFDTLAAGRVYVKLMVVPEGYSMFDIADLVERDGFTTRDDFLAAAMDPSSVRDLAPDAPSLEGFLFPATYAFPRHQSGQQIASAMVKRFRQQWAEISSAAPQTPQPASRPDPAAAEALPLEQTITLASLVERETPKPDERPEVAEVFAKRLRLGVPLQCDPTVVYAMELAGEFPGKLEAADLDFASPYNTYRHKGLPPGPIANPGEASLRAALDPAPTDYLYFVADAAGGHIFSKTLAEHNRNVAIYRRRLAEQIAEERRQQLNAQPDSVPASPSPGPGAAQGWPRRSP